MEEDIDLRANATYPSARSSELSKRAVDSIDKFESHVFLLLSRHPPAIHLTEPSHSGKSSEWGPGRAILTTKSLEARCPARRREI